MPTNTPSALLVDDHARRNLLFPVVMDGVQLAVVVFALLVREKVLKGIVVDPLAVARILFEKSAHRLSSRAPVRGRGVARFCPRFPALLRRRRCQLRAPNTETAGFEPSYVWPRLYLARVAPLSLFSDQNVR